MCRKCEEYYSCERSERRRPKRQRELDDVVKKTGDVEVEGNQIQVNENETEQEAVAVATGGNAEIRQGARVAALFFIQRGGDATAVAANFNNNDQVNSGSGNIEKSKDFSR